MKIKLYWPKCKFLNKQWVDEEIDSYLLECTFEEAETNIFPYLSLDQIEQSKKNWELKENSSQDIQIETDCLYYLVSKDLQSIISFPWYYPYSGQWNAYCPFREIKEVEIKELKDVSSIISDVDQTKTEHIQLKRITSIEIKNMSSGPFSRDEVIGQSLTVYRNGRIKQCLFNGWSIKPIETFQYKVDKSVAESFFEGLVKNIRVNEWKSDYGILVCDGWTWECKIRYSDKSIKKIVGTVKPPPRGVALIKLIKNLIDYKEKPWVF